jgi:Peptidase inhibitor I9
MRLALGLTLLPLCAGAGAPSRRELAPLLKPSNTRQAIPDKFIVKFYDSISVEEDLTSLFSGADHVYDGDFKGFAGSLDADAVKALRADPRVFFRSHPAAGQCNSDRARLSMWSKMLLSRPPGM